MALATFTGRGGRSSVSGIQATVFGSTGFLGRPTVNNLGRMGSQVVVPYRGDEHDTRHLKIMGDYGQIVMVPFHLKEQATVKHVLKEANVCVNVMGQSSPSFNFTLEEANVEGVRNVAKAAKEAGVERFIHVSAMAASPDSQSEWARSKWAGEQAVREIFPDATILRPGSMFGEEDRLLARIAGQALAFPAWPLIDGATAKRSPVAVDDVAEAIGVCIRDAGTTGGTYDLGGPSTYSLEEIYDKIFETLQISPTKVYAPHQVMALQGSVGQWLPTKPLTKDEVYLALEDEVASAGNKTFEDLGIVPQSMESRIGKILLRFKAHEIDARDAGVLL